MFRTFRLRVDGYLHHLSISHQAVTSSFRKETAASEGESQAYASHPTPGKGSPDFYLWRSLFPALAPLCAVSVDAPAGLHLAAAIRLEAFMYATLSQVTLLALLHTCSYNIPNMPGIAPRTRFTLWTTLASLAPC